MHCKKCDFVVFATLAARAGVVLSARTPLNVEPAHRERLKGSGALDNGTLGK
jgi:hypothetical protein